MPARAAKAPDRAAPSMRGAGSRVPAAGAKPPVRDTHEVLLDAGVVVAEREGLAGLSVNRVVALAGVAKGTFYVHFPDREAFVDALHERFHRHVSEAVAGATAGVAPGAELIVAAIDAYLDVCLAERAVKALTLEARADGALTTEMAARHDRFVTSAVPSLREMGWPDARAAAQLLSAMTSELAIRELEAGRQLPGGRRALRRFLGVAEPARSERKRTNGGEGR
jgi:TetR/AcrR family transcriptional repressor of nem operon